MSKWVLEKQGARACTGFFWPRIGTGGGLLSAQSRTIGYHKIQGIYYLAEELLPLKKDSAPCSQVKDKKKAKLCLSMPWSYIEKRGIFPIILDFGSRWSLVVHFMLHCVIPGNEHFYPLNRMPCLDILEKKKILLLSGFEPWTLQSVPQSLYWPRCQDSVCVCVCVWN